MQVLFRDLGNMRYKEAWDIQEELLKEGIAIKSAVRSSGVLIDPMDLATPKSPSLC
jgi:hypothetical protein